MPTLFLDKFSKLAPLTNGFVQIFDSSLVPAVLSISAENVSLTGAIGERQQTLNKK